MSRLVLALALFLTAPTALGAETLRVPADYPTIKSAVSRAADGDTVLVDDGVYLEKNIEITSDISVRSRTLFGAVIYGSPNLEDAVFIVRSAARLDGFVLKGAGTGILQRGSPDVEWQASNLVIHDCTCGLRIDDASENVGSAVVRNVVVLGHSRSVGMTTNDARRIDVSGCLVMDCLEAFEGYDHLFFRVDRCVVLDCRAAFVKNDSHRPVLPATSRIDTGEDVRILSSRSLADPTGPGELEPILRKTVFEADSSGRTSAADKAAREALTALVLGRVSLARQDHRAAARSFESAGRAAERAGSPEFAWQALTGAAGAYRSAGDPERARERYRAAIDHLERWVPAVPVGLHRINFLKDKAPALEALLALLYDAHAAKPWGRYDELAFAYAEKCKALSRVFAPGPAGVGDPEQAGGRASAGARITVLQTALQDPDLGGPDKERLVSLLESAEEDYHAALVAEERRAVREARGNGANERADGRRSPLGYAGVRERLAGRAILSYVLGEEGSFAFLATEAGLSFARLPAAPAIESMIEPYLRFLQLDEGGPFKGARAGRLLFETLLGPFEAELAASPRRIIVVPDGLLHYLPFETLVEGGEGGAGKTRYWAESVDISYAGSATRAIAGGASAVESGGAGGRTARILAVGNSGDIRCDNRSRKLKRFFFPLTHVKKEIEALAKAFGGRSVTTLLDGSAGERAFKAAGLAGFDIVHIASHGVIDDADWWRSALLLKPDAGGAGGPEDGFLTALEISELKMDARLVVLSGCGTGAGSLFKGAGLRGLTGAFRRAGACSLVVSLWSVDDRATAAFMGLFYRFLAGGDPPALALGKAKREMIGGRDRNPFHWAAFVLVGEAADRPIR